MIDQQAYVLSPQILFAAFQDGGVMFNLDTRESHCLNPTAANVVALLDGRHSVSAIIDSLAVENGVKNAAVKTDVVSFLKDIINRGWINDE